MPYSLGCDRAPLEYAKACQLSPIIPLTEVVINPVVILLHVANVCDATEYPPKLTRSCARFPEALPEP